MHHNNQLSNLKMLEFVARKLDNLNDKVVYLGGCTTALFITDPLSLDVRMTGDVDCIIDVISGQYHQLQSELRKKGFKESMKDDVICRWHYDDAVIDIMPTDEKILGFGNCWFQEAMHHSVAHQIAEDLQIKTVTAPYFLATKIEAFKTRGNNDFWASHDFEDMITVISGRAEIVNETLSSNITLQQHIQHFFSDLLKNEQCYEILKGNLNDAPLILNDKARILFNRIENLVKS